MGQKRISLNSCLVRHRLTDSKGGSTVKRPRQVATLDKNLRYKGIMESNSPSSQRKRISSLSRSFPYANKHLQKSLMPC